MCILHNYFFNLENIAIARNIITIPMAIKIIFKISDIPKTVGFTDELIELTLDIGVPWFAAVCVFCVSVDCAVDWVIVSEVVVFVLVIFVAKTGSCIRIINIH